MRTLYLYLSRSLSLFGALASLAAAKPPMPVAIHGKTIHTMAGASIKDGLVLVRDGRITYVGPAAGMAYTTDHRVVHAKVVTPGLIDAHATALTYDRIQWINACTSCVAASPRNTK